MAVNTRLPTDIGWSKPTTTIYQSQIASMTDAMKAVTTIAQATTTAVNLVPQQTRAPFPYNPYQDTIIPADFLQNVIGGVVGLIPNALNVNLTI